MDITDGINSEYIDISRTQIDSIHHSFAEVSSLQFLTVAAEGAQK
jgi:Leucine-rich repeat (LRR) protein